MPCKSSRASISLRPRDRCDRSRRPIGASGGGSGFGGTTIRGGAACRGEAAGFGAAFGSVATDAAGGFTRCRLRSGLTCLATLSHSARSSSLRPRLRRGGTGNLGDRTRRPPFICGSDSGGADAAGALVETGAMTGRGSGSGTIFVASAWMAAVTSGGFSAPFSSLAGSFNALVCGNSLAILSDGRSSGTGSLRPRAAGSRLFGTRMTKRALWRIRPETLPASAPAPK